LGHSDKNMRLLLDNQLNDRASISIALLKIGSASVCLPWFASDDKGGTRGNENRAPRLHDFASPLSLSRWRSRITVAAYHFPPVALTILRAFSSIATPAADMLASSAIVLLNCSPACGKCRRAPYPGGGTSRRISITSDGSRSDRSIT
jgi:hypothetical protein